MAINAPKGMRDMLPDEAAYWYKTREVAYNTFAKYGYVAIETPIAERTELFVRGIGEATDVVSKEMFEAISGENLNTLVHGGHISSSKRLSLRPEGTAGVVRAVVQHDLVPQGAPPAKLMYAGPMFRAEQPQEGRYRQFNQIGVECLGADDASIDAEAIIMCMRFFAEIGLSPKDMVLLVNSMGCDECRPAYRERVREYARARDAELCENCLARLDVNPLRIFDCKNEACRKVMEDAPLITDNLCGNCKSHYDELLAMISEAGLTYKQDPTLVRGLDYYTRTVFEVQLATKDGAQNALGGGGRYDKLADEVRGDGKNSGLSGFGFAIGYERCKEALLKKGMQLPNVRTLQTFIACATDDVREEAFKLAQTLRDGGIICDFDHQSRSLKSQFKLADKLNSQFVVILGPDELAAGEATVRNMQSHEEENVPFNNLLCTLQKKLQDIVFSR